MLALLPPRPRHTHVCRVFGLRVCVCVRVSTHKPHPPTHTTYSPTRSFLHSVARYFVELEIDKGLSADLRDLYFTAAKEVDCGAGKKAVVIFVPYKQHTMYKKIQSRLVSEVSCRVEVCGCREPGCVRVSKRLSYV